MELDLRSGGWHRSLRWISAGAAVTGVLLPVGSLAVWASSLGRGGEEELRQGFWLLKASLVFTALVLEVVRRCAAADARTDSGGPRRRRSQEREVGAESAAGSIRGEPLLWVIVGVALVARSIGLGESLWYDEILTYVRYIELPLAGLLTTFDSQNNHLLYSVLAHASTSVLGDGPVGLRVPAVVFGVGSLWAVYALAVQLDSDRRGRTIGLLAAAALALSYHHVWFSQNARGYTALMFFVVVATTLFLRMFDARGMERTGALVSYALTAALAVFAHLTGAFVLAGHGIVWAVARLTGRAGRSWTPPLGLLLAGSFVLVLYSPVLPQVYSTVFGTSESAVEVVWTDVSWMVAEIVSGLSTALPGGRIALVMGACVGALGLVSYARTAPLGLAVMIAPVALGTSVLIATGHNLWPRFFFFAAGFATLIGLRGALTLGSPTRRRPRWEKVATGGIAVAVLATVGVLPRAWNPKQTFQAVVDHVAAVEGQAAEAVVVVGTTRVPFIEYLGLPWLEVQSVAELQAIERSHERTRVVTMFRPELETTHPDVLERIERDYSEEVEFGGTVVGGEVTVWRRP